MTKRAVVSQAQISRAIRALQKAGLRVKGVANDGTVLVDTAEDAANIARCLDAEAQEAEEQDPQWSDDE